MRMQATTTTSFGDCLEQSGSGRCNGLVGLTPAHFTDQDRDSETGLDHFMFRQYSSVQGRWMSPDPAGLAAVDPTNPQTWNRYAYVTGNPTNAADPLGLKQPLVQGGALIGAYIGDFTSLGGGTVYTSDPTGSASLVSSTTSYQNPGDLGTTYTVHTYDSSGLVGTWTSGSGFGIAGMGDSSNYAVVSDGSGEAAAANNGLLPSCRLPGEGVLQCVDRLEKATLGDTGQAILRGVSGTALFTGLVNASVLPKTTEVVNIATRETTTVTTRISLVSKLSEVFPKGFSAAVKSVSPVIGKASGILLVGGLAVEAAYALDCR